MNVINGTEQTVDHNITEFETQPPYQGEIKRITDAPEGKLAAPKGTMVADANGRVYVKRSTATETSGWQLLLPVMVFNTLAELQAYTYYAHNDVAFTLGDTTAFDFGEGMGLFVFRSAELTADDSATTKNCIRPDDIASDLLPGRWMLWDAAWTNS